MKKKYGYDPYRGRSPLRTFLKSVALLLAVVLVLSLAALFFLDPYFTYTVDGVKIHLPWDSPQENSPTSTATPSPTLVVVHEEPQTPVIHAAPLPPEALSDGSAVRRLQEAGANAALFDMKTDSGTLAFISASPLALQAGINPSDTGRNDAISALNAQEDLYTIARISCFRDNTMPRWRNDMAIRSPAGNWMDSESCRWLSPSVQDSRQYITDLCLELAALGFDEILLDNAAFPIDGNLSYILQNENYDRNTITSVLSDFYTQLLETLRAQYPQLRVSVTTDDSALRTGAGSISGHTLSLLAGSGLDRIWVLPGESSIDTTAVFQQLSQAGFPAGESCLVPILSQAGPKEESWSLWWDS